MKKVGLFFGLMLTMVLSYGQASQATTISEDVQIDATKNFYLGLGLMINKFQDAKYSDTKYAGVGGVFELGFNRQKNKYSLEAGIQFNGGFYTSATSEFGSGKTFNPIAYFKYMRRVNDNWYVGGRLDAIDFVFRSTDLLGNNASSYLNGSHLSASVQHKYRINKSWVLQSFVDIGLFTIEKELVGFGFSAPQKALEEGAFNYQNKGLADPFSYTFLEYRHIANSINWNTSFQFQFKNRISLIYSWHLRKFSTVKSYPLTYGTHNIIFRYNLIHRNK